MSGAAPPSLAGSAKLMEPAAAAEPTLPARSAETSAREQSPRTIDPILSRIPAGSTLARERHDPRHPDRLGRMGLGLDVRDQLQDLLPDQRLLLEQRLCEAVEGR